MKKFDEHPTAKSLREKQSSESDNLSPSPLDIN